MTHSLLDQKPTGEFSGRNVGCDWMTMAAKGPTVDFDPFGPC